MSASCYQRKDFQKKMALPTVTSFLPSDLLLSAKALSLIKHKGLFFNRFSRVAFRRVAILCNGTMLIYENETKGWTIDLHQIKTMKTKMTRKMSDHMRVQIDLKTHSGSVILVVDGTQMKQWMNVFSHGLEEEMVERPDSLVSLFDEEGVLSVEVAEDLKGRFGEEEKSLTTGSDPSSIFEPESIVETPILVPKKISTTSEALDTESFSHGPQSVATLRSIIEAKARVSVRKMRRESKSISAVPTVLVMAEEKQEEKEKKSRLPHLGKSRSAPAVLNATKMKKLVQGMYDSCFDSVRA